MNRPVIAFILLIVAVPRSFGFGFASQIQELPQQQLVEYEAQGSTLIAAAQQMVSTDPSPRKGISGRLLLAPIVHSYSYQREGKKGFYHLYRDYWRFNEKGSNSFTAEQAYNALQNVLDWTYSYMVAGIKERGYSYTPASIAVRERGVPASVGKPAQSVHTDKAAIASYGSYTYTSPDFNDWAEVPFSAYAGLPSFQGAVFIRGSDRWVYRGEAQMNGEAIIEYGVHHRFEVKVCTIDNQACKVVRIPKDGADLTTRLFIPSMKAVDDAKLKANHLAALKLAGRHNADIILIALDAAMEKAP